MRRAYESTGPDPVLQYFTKSTGVLCRNNVFANRQHTRPEKEKRPVAFVLNVDGTTPTNPAAALLMSTAGGGGEAAQAAEWAQ